MALQACFDPDFCKYFERIFFISFIAKAPYNLLLKNPQTFCNVCVLFFVILQRKSLYCGVKSMQQIFTETPHFVFY